MAAPTLDASHSERATSRYFHRNFGKDAVTPLPGEYSITGEDIVLVTVLGSCVAACLRDPYTGIGGMNHIMLPEAGGDPDNPLSASARYGVYGMELLINELTKASALRSRLEAKVFGGGSVLPGLEQVAVGSRNASFAVDFLSVEQIPVRAKDRLDQFPRKVYFFPKTGKVMVKRLRTLANETVLERERNYRCQINSARVCAAVERFS